MNENITYVRLITPTDDLYDWLEVKRRLSSATLVWPILLFKPWLTVTAPKNTPSEMTNGFGDPLYQYKTLNGRTYYLSMEPSPGFPSSC